MADSTAMVMARRHWPIWIAVVPIALWATIRLFGLERGYPLVPLMAYTPYAAVGALLVAGVAVALRNWPAALVATLATAALMAVVLPRAFGGVEAIPAGDSELRVLAANVHKGEADPVALLGLVKHLDVGVLSVEELTPRFGVELRRAGIGRILPFSLRTPVEGEVSGTAIYSRYPLRLLMTPLRISRQYTHAEILLPTGTAVRVAAVHTFPPKVPSRVGEWQADMENLPRAEPAGPLWILLGDFNATLDQAALRDVIASGYRDAGEVTGKGLEPTWPQGRWFPPPFTIDHVLADRRIAIAGYAVEGLPGSDHRAVFARLGIPEAGHAYPADG